MVLVICADPPNAGLPLGVVKFGDANPRILPPLSFPSLETQVHRPSLSRCPSVLTVLGGCFCSDPGVFFKNLFILLLSALGLCCFVQAFSNCRAWGLVSAAACRRLTEAASLVADHRLQSVGSAVVAHRLGCSMAHGVIPDQGWNPCPLYWQVDSYPWTTRGAPDTGFSEASLLQSSLAKAG